MKTSSEEKVVTIVTWEGELVGDTPEVKVARALRERFDQAYPNIKVVRRTQPSGEERKVFATAMAGGTGPDLAEIPGADTRTYIEQEFAADLTEFVENWDEFKNIYSNMLEPVNKDNKCYGIPREFYMMHLIFRTDLYKQVGLDPQKPPLTWDELVEHAKRLTDSSQNRYGFALLGMDYCAWHFMDYVWQAGGDFAKLDPKTGKLIATFQEEPGVVALQFYKDLRWKHNVIQKNVLQDYRDLNNDFVAGRTGIFKFYAQELPYFINKGLISEQIGLAPLPAGPGKVPVSQMGPRVYIINPTISKEKQQAAFEYIKYLVSKKTIINRWKLQEKYGILAPTIPIWKGMRQSDYVDFPENWSQAIEEQSKYARPEPFFPYWDKVKQYLVQPIQAVLLKRDADPQTEMKKCADRVQKDLFDKVGPVDL